VGEEIIGTEYGLMAQTVYLQELLEAGGEADQYELFKSVADTLREVLGASSRSSGGLDEDAEATSSSR